METLRAQEASSSTSRCSYHVFLSFRGSDTRKTFTDHLYTALVQAGFRTFRDDEGLERGKHVKSELNRAIQQSRLSLIVLSKGYASSEWCLDELLMMLECKKISGHLVVPVFYHVEPSDVRCQTGNIKEAFDRYEEKLEEESKKEWMERVNGWRAALKEVADLSGMVLQNQSDGYIQLLLKLQLQRLGCSSTSPTEGAMTIAEMLKRNSNFSHICWKQGKFIVRKSYLG